MLSNTTTLLVHPRTKPSMGYRKETVSHTFAYRQEKIWIPGMKFQFVDCISVAHVVLQQNPESGFYSRCVFHQKHAPLQASETHLYALHCYRINYPNDAPGASHSQQRMACVAVIGPRTSIKVFICLKNKVKGYTNKLRTSFGSSSICAFG